MAAQKYIINGLIFEDNESGEKIIVDGGVLETLAAAAGGITPIPPPLQKTDNQFATIIAHRLGGVLQ